MRNRGYTYSFCMKKILLIILGSLVIGIYGALADGPQQEQPRYKFARFEATETSWDYTSLIYDVTDAAGHSISVPASHISYEVTDINGDQIAYGKGVFISINDFKLESEEDIKITITAVINKEKETISKTIMRKASPKKLSIKQEGTSFSYSIVRPKYNDPDRFESMNIKTAPMNIEVSYTECRQCATVQNYNEHIMLNNSESYKQFEKVIKEAHESGRSVKMLFKPTVKDKRALLKYAQSTFEVGSDAIRELHEEEATADK